MANATKKILIVTTGFPVADLNANGGKFVLHEAMAYSNQGAEVTVLTPLFPRAKEVEKIHENIIVKRFKYFFTRKAETLINPIDNSYDNFGIKQVLLAPFFVFSFILNVFKYSKGADIVHCQWTPTVLFVLPCRPFRSFRLIVTARGSDIRLLPKMLNKFIMRMVDASINCYGEGWFETLKEFPSNYIKLPLITKITPKGKIPLDLANFFEINEGAFHLVFLGRFDDIKLSFYGYPILLLVEAVSALKKEGRKLSLTYIGDGTLEDKLKVKIVEYGLEQEITILGPRNEPDLYLPHFDCGFGGGNTDAVAQEIAFAEIPQIQVSSLPDVPISPWTDGVNNNLFEAGSLDSLLQKIRFCMDEKQQSNEILKRTKEVMQQYAVGYEKGGELYLKEFDKLLNL